MKELGSLHSNDKCSKAALASIALSLLTGAVALMAGPGYRLGWWGLGLGIKAISWSGIASAAVLSLALICAVTAHKKQLHSVAAKFVAGAVIGALTAVPVAYFGYQANTLPRIHDVSTDLVNPPQFVALLPLRKDAKNPAQYDSKVASLQREGYPDIAPISIDKTSPEVFARAQQVAQSSGWDMVSVESNALRIEATATTFLFGFKDDIVIRVTPTGTGSTVDIRSLSRVGGSDIGTNAGRIRDFRRRLLDATTSS
jgi:uncharacterized protein (DUF1499 family)